MNRTIAIFSLAAVATGVALTASGASTGTLYSNDFATRTSSDATPSGRWMEAAYVGGKLVRPVSSISENGREPYNNSTEYQDAWTMKTGYCRTEVTFTVADDGGNMGALVNASKSVNSASVAMQPFYNEFTTGVLYISVDIRTPSLTDSFNSSAIACATLVPIYKSALEVSASAFPAPMRFGPANLQDTSGVWHLCAATRGRETANSPVGSYFGQNDSRNAIASGSWVRYGAEINLDAGTYTATFTNLGTGHPTPDTAGGSAVDFRQSEGDANSTTFAFLDPLTPETGGIAGLAFYVQGIIKDAANAAYAPMFDNIAVYWKARGEGKDYALVYENDFSTRRYRQVEPADSNIGSYVPVLTTNVVQSSFYGRGTGTTDYGISESNARRLVPDGAPYLGQDGWRRIAGDAPFAMVDPNNNGGYGWDNKSVLRATGSGETGMVAVPLGTTVTSGKVRLSCDILMGALTNSTSQTRDIAAAAFLAGNGAFTNAWYDASVIRSAYITTALRDKGVCGAGTCRPDMEGGAYKTNTWIYGFNGSGYSPQDPGRDDGGSFYSGKWGRFIVTLDLDAGTYDISVYDLGSVGQAMDYTTSSGNELVSTNGLALAASAVRNVDSVVLFSEGQDSRRSDNKYTDTYHGKRLGRFPLFDNVRVCLVNDDGTEGTELYACNFEYGYRLSVQNAASLAAHSDREGADRWIRRGNTYGTINAVDAGGGDNVVILDGFGQKGNETRAGYAVQPFGAVTKGLDSVEFTADIRPPERFADSSGCYAYVEVGGDAYAQGVYRPKTSSSWRVEPRIGFGFSVGAGKDDVGLYTNVLISVQTNTATVATAVSTNSNYVIDKSHWYRFRVTADQTNETFTVKVYDQGAAKPAASDADGTLVATFEDLELPDFGDNGMTTFGLAGAGFASTFGSVDDPGVVLVDNLSASEYRIPAGFIAFLEENGIPTDTDPMTVTNGIPLAARYVYGIEPMDAMTNAEGHLLVDFQLSTDGAPVFELAPEKRPDDFGLIFSMLWSRTLSPWETLGEMCFDADNDGDDTLCHPPVNTSNEPCMFFKYRIVLPGYESPVEDPQTAFVDIAVKIIWNDNHNLDGNRPASVTIRLYADGVEVDSHVLTDAENWQFTFAENPRYQEDGKTEITYTVREDAVPMYAVTIGGYSIVNDYLPEVTSVSVSKVWDDNNNSQCLRPSSITMTLSDGQKAVKSVILNAANEWAAIVDNLPTVVNGQPAQYTWSEQNVLGYELKEVTQQGSLTIFCNQIWDRPDNPSSGTKPKIPGEGGYEPEPDPGEGPL